MKRVMLLILLFLPGTAHSGEFRVYSSAGGLTYDNTGATWQENRSGVGNVYDSASGDIGGNAATDVFRFCVRFPAITDSLTVAVIDSLTLYLYYDTDMTANEFDVYVLAGGFFGAALDAADFSHFTGRQTGEGTPHTSPVMNTLVNTADLPAPGNYYPLMLTAAMGDSVQDHIGTSLDLVITTGWDYSGNTPGVAGYIGHQTPQDANKPYIVVYTRDLPPPAEVVEAAKDHESLQARAEGIPADADSIRYYIDGAWFASTAAADSDNVAVATGLTFNTQYAVTAKTFSSTIGLSDPSGAVNITTTLPPAENTPSNIAAANIRPTDIDAVATTDGNEFTTAIRWYLDTAFRDSTVYPDTTYTFTGLDPETAYTIQAAVNGPGGLSAPTAELPVTTASPVYYVDDSATGAGDGSDWTNAFTSLPAALIRGGIYWLADGAYGSYIFDDAVSDTTSIQVRKATALTHGTAVGWNDSLGDGQALFVKDTEEAGILTVQTGNLIISGTSRADSISGHGIKLVTGQGRGIYNVDPLENVTVEYIEIEGVGDDQDAAPPNDLVFVSSVSSNLLFQYCYLHDAGRTIFLGRGADFVTIDHCYSARNENVSLQHSEAISAFNGTDNWTVRNSVWRDIEGTGVIVFSGDSWNVYGNLIYETDAPGYDGVSNGSITTWGGYEVTNANVYNNTIYGIEGPSNTGITFSAANDNKGNQVFNNVMYHMASTVVVSGATHDYNSAETDLGEDHDVVLQTDPFIDSANYDFDLKATAQIANAGLALNPPYDDIDPYGYLRGEDGFWDIGAFESQLVYIPPDPPTEYNIFASVGGRSYSVMGGTWQENRDRDGDAFNATAGDIGNLTSIEPSRFLLRFDSITDSLATIAIDSLVLYLYCERIETIMNFDIYVLAGGNFGASLDSTDYSHFIGRQTGAGVSHTSQVMNNIINTADLPAADNYYPITFIAAMKDTLKNHIGGNLDLVITSSWDYDAIDSGGTGYVRNNTPVELNKPYIVVYTSNQPETIDPPETIVEVGKTYNSIQVRAEAIPTDADSIRYYMDDTWFYTVSIADSDMVAEATGLDYHTQYSLSAKSYNAGDILSVPTATLVTTELPPPPAAPATIAAQGTTASSITAAVTVPGSQFISSIYWYLNGALADSTVYPHLTYTYGPLAPKTQYQIQAASNGPGGVSGRTSALDVTTRELVQNPPLAITGVSMSYNSIQIRAEGVPVDADSVRYYIDSTWFQSVAVADSNMTVSADSLTYNTQYSFAARAYHHDKALSNPTDTITIRTTLPPAPDDLKSIVADQVSMTSINTIATTDGFSFISSFYWYINGALADSTVFPDSTYTFTGLTVATTYDIQAAANGPGGLSGFTPPLTVTTSSMFPPGKVVEVYKDHRSVQIRAEGIPANTDSIRYYIDSVWFQSVAAADSDVVAVAAGLHFHTRYNFTAKNFSFQFGLSDPTDSLIVTTGLPPTENPPSSVAVAGRSPVSITAMAATNRNTYTTAIMWYLNAVLQDSTAYPDTTYTFTGLSLSTSYTIQAAANGPGGMSTRTAPIPAATTGLVFHVDDSAGGAGDGSDWTNAFASLPDTLWRGGVYWIADGFYGSYTFDDEPSDAQSIQIRKATPSAHGMSVGWHDSLGDGQANFTSIALFYGDVVLSGSARTGIATGYGIKVSPSSGPAISAGNSAITDLVVEYVEIEGAGEDGDGDGNALFFAMPLDGASSHMTIRNCYFHDAGRSMIRIGNTTDVTIDHCYFARNGYAGSTGDTAGLWAEGGAGNWVVSNNTWEDIGTVGVIVMQEASDWDIYGNIMYETGLSAYAGVSSGAVCSLPDFTVQNAGVYNNTMYGLSGNTTGIEFGVMNNGNGNRAMNNVFYRLSGDVSAGFTGCDHDFNAARTDLGEANNVLITTDPFIDSETFDFNPLETAEIVNTGTNLGPPYDIDPAGNQRGKDGSWDIGAFEYRAGGVHVGDEVPMATDLGQNRPNPFNAMTIIPFTLSAAGTVRLTVYSIGGQTIRELVNGTLDAGQHTAVWDGTDDSGNSLASGMYLYRLQAGNTNLIHGMMYLK